MNQTIFQIPESSIVELGLHANALTEFQRTGSPDARRLQRMPRDVRGLVSSTSQSIPAVVSVAGGLLDLFL